MNKRKILLTLVSVGLIVPALVWANEVWDSSFEASPGNSDAVSAGAGKIRDSRSEVRQRADVEHKWGASDTDKHDNGAHRQGSARAFYQSTAPTALAEGMSDYDNTGGAGVTDLNNPESNADGVEDSDDLGDGRLWVDTDDNKLYVYDGVAGAGGGAWDPVVTARVKAGSPNLLSNNDFDWDGCTGTSTPSQWGLDGTTPTIAYANTDATEGDGCEVIVTGAGAANEQIVQTLTNLQASTNYLVVARAHADGVDTCRLNTTGASTDVSNQDTTSATYVTLSGTFTTAAALDTVDINLISVNDTDVCSWDHVGVYRQSDEEIPTAGIVAVYDTYTTSDGADIEELAAGFADVPDLSIPFIPPTEGWVVSLKASISAGCPVICNLASGGDEGIICRIEKDGNAVAGTTRVWTGSGTGEELSVSLAMDTIDINPTPGTSTTYTVGCREVGINAMLFNPQTNDGDDVHSSLSMIAYPPQ